VEPLLESWLSVHVGANDGVVAGQGLDGAVEADIFVDTRVLRIHGDSAANVLSSGARSLVRTVGAVASVNSLLESGLVGPALEEVTVQTVTLDITHSEGPLLPVGVVLGVIEELVEDRVDSNWVRLGADTTSVTLDGPCHVREMVGAVKILAVPASGEVGVGKEPVARLSWETWVAGRLAIAALAGGPDSLSRVAAGIVFRMSEGRVARDDSQASRRSLGLEVVRALGAARSVIASTVEIVDCGTLERDHLKASIIEVAVQLRLPIVAVVELTAASGVL